MIIDPDLFDDDGEPAAATLYGCNCDMDNACTVPQCEMERDLEVRRMYRAFVRGELDPPPVVEDDFWPDPDDERDRWLDMLLDRADDARAEARERC